MPGRDQNASPSKTFRVTISIESFRLLNELAGKGIYGRSEAEVAARFIDLKLAEFVEQPKLKLKED